jgi:hypothetical protein
VADAWKNYKQAIANKRVGNKKKSPSSDILKKEEIIIQRLSTEVSGKAQKYSRIGPREFVPYEYDEVSISNIKEACMKHFASTIGNNQYIDLLAGEQGPSCTSVDHIPDLRVVHIRFVEEQSTSVLKAVYLIERQNGSIPTQRLQVPSSHYHVVGSQVQVKFTQKVYQ